MNIGDLANLTGVASSAIRYYEQCGLLPMVRRGDNGYRSYSNEAVERIRLIKLAQSVGFSLETMQTWFASAEGVSKEELLRNLDTRLAEMDALIANMRKQRNELRTIRDTFKSTWEAGLCVDPVLITQRATSAEALKVQNKPHQTVEKTVELTAKQTVKKSVNQTVKRTIKQPIRPTSNAAKLSPRPR